MNPRVETPKPGTATPAPAQPPLKPPAPQYPEAEITPDHVAAVSKKSLESCRQAARDVRDLGETLRAMSAKVVKGCDNLADDLEKYGADVAEQALQHAKDIVAVGENVALIRERMPRVGGSRVVPRNGAGENAG